MNATPERVMITGAGGFIGSHLVDDQLGRGRHVVATDVDVAALRDHPAGDRLTAIRADLRASDEMRSMLEGVDVVFHLAAAHLDVLKDASYYDEVNVTATRELAAMAATAGVRRFVHCSSVAVYGPLETLPANEDTRCAPDIVYEKSKLDGESAIRELASRVGLSTVILRPAWVYGPRCPRTRKLIRTIARKRFFFVGEATNMRHPVYISDVTDAFEKAATCHVSGLPTLNIAGPQAVSLRELVAVIATEVGVSSRMPTFPKAVVTAGCMALETIAGLVKREPPFSRRSLKFFTESSAFETVRAREILGFEPVTQLRDGIHATVDYYRSDAPL